jgi:hypothetical protein
MKIDINQIKKVVFSEGHPVVLYQSNSVTFSL